MSTSPAFLITGATRGLGLETARALAADRGGEVVLAVRDVAAGARVAADLGPDVRAVALDLADLDAVSAFTVDRPLAGVVANAGLQHRNGTTTTAAGFESTFAVNHLAHALLLERLLPSLTPDARVAIVSSGTHDPRLRRNGGFPEPVWPDDLRTLAQPDPAVAGGPRYAASKLANLIHARGLARRLSAEGSAVRVNAFDPGLMPGSGLARDYPAAGRWVWDRVMPVLTVLPGVNTTATSGADLATLVTDPALVSLHGEYVVRRHAEPPSALAQDDTQIDRLAEATADLLAPWTG